MKLFEISLVNDSQLYYTSVTLRCYLKKIQLRISESKTKNNESKTNCNENSYILVFLDGHWRLCVGRINIYQLCSIIVSIHTLQTNFRIINPFCS